MGIPALINFTSPIVETALKTGARGSESKTTNYGVIGDAMFKKAQLDLGIADLQADIGMKQASLMSGLEMQKAGLQYDIARSYMDTNLKLRDMQMELEANEVGFFEGLLNTAAGAVGGVATALTFGAAAPIAIGAGVLGGAATAGAQMESGRRGAHGALSAIGTIANGAQMIKSISQQNSAQDALEGWSDKAQWLSGMIGNPQVRPEQQAQARQQLEAHFSQLGADLVASGYNPQQALETVNGLRGIYSGGGGGRRGVGKDGMDDWTMNNLNQAFQAKADDRFDNPQTARQAKKEFLANAAVNYASAHGGDEMPASVGEALLEASGINQRPGIMALNRGKKGVEAPRIKSRSPEQVNPATLAQDTAPKRMVDPKKGRPINQPPAQYRDKEASVNTPIRSQGAAIAAQGPGLQMDDGKPAITEQDILKQGAETVKALESTKEEEGFMDELSKITPFTHTDKADRNIEVEKKIMQAKKRTEKTVTLKREADRQEKLGDVEVKQLQEERELRHPGLREKRLEEREKLEQAAPEIDKMPEKDVAQRNRKQGLKDAVAAAKHLDDVMEKIPDGLYTRFAEFIQAEGIGIRSPHLSVDSLDEVAKAMVSEEAQTTFTDAERDLLDEWRIEAHNLAYADALMDAGARGVSQEQLKVAKPQMPGFSDDYRQRSNKLQVLMRGYRERINDATKSSESESEQLDLEYKRRRNAKMLQSQPKASAQRKKKLTWLDID